MSDIAITIKIMVKQDMVSSGEVWQASLGKAKQVMANTVKER